MVFFSQNSASTAVDAVTAVLIAVFAVACMAALIYFLCRSVENDLPVPHARVLLLGILGVGLVLRIVFAFTIRGYREDYNVFKNMIEQFGSDGLGDYYAGNASAVLYPVTYFIYLIFGGLANVTGLSDHALGMQFAVKLPLIVAELLSAFAVYLTANRYFNKRVGLTLAAFVCVCPIFYIGSSIWCSQVPIMAMFACFGCYFLARKKHALTIMFMTLAAFSSKEGIYLFPVVCVYSVFRFIVAAKAPATESIASDERRALITVPVGFFGSLIGVYLIGLFEFYSYGYNPFVYIYEFLLEPFAQWSAFTYNGLSIYTIFNQNGVGASARFPSWIFAAVFYAIVIAVVCVVYFTKRNRATLVMLAAYSVYTILLYYPGMSTVGFAAVPVLLVTAYALVRDKRLLHVLFVLGIAFTVNSVAVLANAGYMNNTSDYILGQVETLMKGGASAVPIVCSVLTVLAHLYFTVVAVTVGMTGQKKMLSAASGLGGSIAEYFSGGNKKN